MLLAVVALYRQFTGRHFRVSLGLACLPVNGIGELSGQLDQADSKPTRPAAEIQQRLR